MGNQTQIDQFKNLLVDIKQRIHEIDDDTEWQETEPDWWIDMMEIRRAASNAYGKLK